jgi:hypothetical protein
MDDSPLREGDVIVMGQGSAVIQVDPFTKVRVEPGKTYHYQPDLKVKPRTGGDEPPMDPIDLLKGKQRPFKSKPSGDGVTSEKN